MQKAVQQQEMRSWREGEVVDFQGAMQRISLSVIANAVFGLADPEESARTQKLAVTLHGESESADAVFQRCGESILASSCLPRPTKRAGEMENALAARIAESRSRPPSEDILSMMIHAHYDDGSTMSDAQIQDELFTLLLAGHETTALGLSWMFYHLYRNPETLVKLRQELHALGPHPEAESIAQCRYLDACANESLRLYPVVAETFRKLRVPIELGPYTVPAGHAVSVSAIGVHHNPAIYPNPQRFRPERFPRAQVHSVRVRSVRWRNPSLFGRGVCKLRNEAGRARNPFARGAGACQRQRDKAGDAGRDVWSQRRSPHARPSAVFAPGRTPKLISNGAGSRRGIPL